MTSANPEDYPAEWETTVVLADGSTAAIRPIRPDDAARLADFHGRQSQESIYFRYFRFRPTLSESEIEHFTTVDYRWRMAFIALVGDEMVAVARYEGKEGDPTAEVAFFVDDRQQRKGLGTLLLEFLAAAARRAELDGLTATVLAENYRMLRVFRKAGFAVESSFVDGVIEVDLGIELTDEAAAAIAERARSSTVRSVARLLEPTSIAVVGASRRAGALGRALFDQMIASGFPGPVVPVNPNAERIGDHPAIDRLTSLDEPVDLAVVAVPTDAVSQVIDDGIAAGIGGFVVISAGPTADGAAAGAEALIASARASGVRLIGPNSFGVLTTHPDHRFHALFVPVPVEAGRVGVVSQSGPLGASLLERLTAASVGVSSFVAMGDRSDVSVNDVLEYFSADERTDVVVGYLDNVGNPRNFARIARRLAADKTVIVTGAGPELRAMLEQSGVAVAARAGDLVSIAAMATHQPPPDPDGATVVLSNSASIGRLCAAAADRHGLRLATPDSVDEIDGVHRGDVDGVVLLPVDRPLEELETTIAGLSLSAGVGSVVLAVTPSLQDGPGDVAAALDRIDDAVDKPMVATALVGDDHISASGLPVFRFPGDAVAALAPLHRIARWRRDHDPSAGVVDLDRPAAERLAEVRARAEAEGTPAARRLRLGDPDLAAVLDANDVETPTTRLIAGADGLGDRVVAAVAEVGAPVVIKAGGLDRRYPGLAGGVALDLTASDEVRAAVESLWSIHGEAGLPLVVQSMVTPGRRARIEVEADRRAGTWLRAGIDGGAVSSLLLPATTAQVERVAVALAEHDAEIAGLRRLLRAVAAIGADPAVRALRCDPVLVSASGVELIELDLELDDQVSGPLDEVRHLGD